MSKYENAYGKDWDTLDRDEAISRAYALGVASTLGEYHPDELEAIREEVETAYQKSVVDLAFDEGRTEGREYEPGDETEEPTVWAELVEGEEVVVDEEGVFTRGKDSLPEALDKTKILDKPSFDRKEALELPEFLEKE